MSIWLLSLLASFVLLLAMGTIIWWRQYQLAQKREDKEVRPCGCSSACADHLHQISEPPPKK
ncbi:hypothetical protein [Aeromonas veronii]|uniref:hypothetical protein n=1 Tax=Aeromonas veronii TaxID=654 RepID=UPI00214D9C63|nr:hypothetical protein [Aeromonas veronii]MCR3969083.1 hypothetical protein [Aeromonas veronii]MCR3981548.1 hypothetical protein [Aeromonas veronii]